MANTTAALPKGSDVANFRPGPVYSAANYGRPKEASAPAVAPHSTVGVAKNERLPNWVE